MIQLPRSCETLELSSRGNVLIVTLNRPEVRNAMNLAMCHELRELFDALSGDDGTGAVVLRGAGSAFCAGIDVKEFSGQTGAWKLARRNYGLDAYLAIERAPMPVVAAVHGALVGAGCEIMAACDFAIASTDATLRWPEGMLGAVGATQRLPRIVGMPMARDLLFTGRHIDAAQAFALRLVTRVTPPSGLDQAIEELIAQLAAAHADTLRLMKRSMRLGEHLPLEAAVGIERQIIERSLSPAEPMTPTD